MAVDEDEVDDDNDLERGIALLARGIAAGSMLPAARLGARLRRRRGSASITT